MITFPNTFFNKVHEEYHYAFLNKSQEFGLKKTPPSDQLNILVIIFDSLSHSHTVRSLKQTYKYLSQHPTTVIMKVRAIAATTFCLHIFNPSITKIGSHLLFFYMNEKTLIASFTELVVVVSLILTVPTPLKVLSALLLSTI